MRRGDPAEMPSTPAYSRAFMPSVATIGLRPSRPTRSPLPTPAAIATTRPRPRAASSLLSSPLGWWVEMTTAREIGAGHGQVEAALLHDERLTDGRDGEHGGERQHAEQRAPTDAGRRHEGARHEQEHERRP